MPIIQAVASAVPAHRVDQAEAIDFARRMFGGHIRNLDRLLPLFTNAGIETRYFAAPPQWLSADHNLAEKSAMYVQEALALSAEAAEKALAQAQLQPTDIDYIIYVNTTGLATPSLDARLINKMGLRPDVRRTPIWGLGCAGGAAGLSHAHHYALAHPKARILVITTELCGLTFLPRDRTKSNLVATALFGDGSAAAVICGDQLEGEGLKTLDTRSRFYPDSEDVMGWTVLQEGLQVVFAQRIPRIVAETAADDIGSFLDAHDLKIADLEAFLLHPGGAKVLQAYEDALALEPAQLEGPRSILRDYGNMSSATVLFLLERYLNERGAGNGGHGLITALGPGFCSESLLVEL